MKKISIILTVLVISFVSCEKDDGVEIKNGVLKGSIGLYEGNCMPINTCTPSPISTEVAITKPSEHFDKDLLVKTVISSEKGAFEVNLPEGNYSIFLKDGDEYVCDSWTCPGECYCTFITVKQDSVTNVTANIDHAAW
ncbi:MAG: hypothetical protein MI922_18305 [Bacteroidales bacterium]|nr:hypothetical protein [Bacteroidales bacterium]